MLLYDAATAKNLPLSRGSSLQVQQAHVLVQSTAHVVSPIAAAPSAQPIDMMRQKARKQAARKASAGVGMVVALDAAACLAEMLVMGSGLVEEVLVRQLL